MQRLEDQIRIGKLITSHLSGKMDVIDKAELTSWINKSDANAILFNAIVDEASLAKAIGEISDTDTENALGKVKTRIRQSKSLHGFMKYAAVAACVCIAIGIWVYNGKYVGNRNREDVYTADAAPGKNKATLTLANGEVIALSEKKTGILIDATKLVYNDGTAISKNAPALDGSQSAKDVKMMTVATPRGGTYIIKLVDGTMVTLNAASSIEFPSKFNPKERLVKLLGEAYFSVKHNSKQPFRVVSGRQILEDLGTEFNINSYVDDDNIKTTLLSGAAQVSLLQGGVTTYNKSNAISKMILSPGQQSILQGTSLQVKTVNPELAVAWKNGNFMFKSERLGEIMKKVQRWYDVDVMYEERSLVEMKFSGTISRYENVSKLLDMLQTTGLVEFRTEGKKITVYK